MIRTWLLALCLVFSSVAVAAAAPTLKVAHDATWPPMEFTDEKLNLVGYSVDYIAAVAEEAGFKAESMNVPWEGIFAGLVGKRYDVIASSVTITDERKKVMDFSIPYYEVRQALVTPKEVEVKSLEDMVGKKVGAQIGTTGFKAIDKIKGVNAMTYDEIGLAMADLAAGRIDAVILDDPVASNFVLENKEYKEKMHVALIVDTDEHEYYGFAVNKGNKEVLDLLNKGITAVKEKGIEDELRKKWIGGN